MTKTRPFLSMCYGDPSATEVPPCCETATKKLTFSTTSVLLLLNMPLSLSRATIFRRQKNPRRVYRPKIAGILFVCNEPEGKYYTVPTWLWRSCGRHNSPPASSVMDFILCRSDGSHVLVDTVLPSLTRSSSFSSPRWYHIEGHSSDVVLVSPLDVSNPPQSCFPAPLCGVLSLMPLFLTWYHSVCGRMPTCTSSFLSLPVSTPFLDLG